MERLAAVRYLLQFPLALLFASVHAPWTVKRAAGRQFWPGGHINFGYGLVL